jgi:hypothetical protein
MDSFWAFFLYNCEFYYSKIKVLKNDTAFFVSVSFVRGKYERTRENKNNIFQALVAQFGLFSQEY